MALSNINFNHPIVFGIVAAIVTLIIAKIDVNRENNRLKLKMETDPEFKSAMLRTNLLLPFVIGGLVWATAAYFRNSNANPMDKMVLNGGGSSSSILDGELEIFSDMDFEG